MRGMSLPAIKSEYIDFNGGLDLVTPSMKARPGTLRKAQNFEIDVNGGYQDIKGYERFDGRPGPSDAIYAILPVTITGTIAVGNTITGVTSGATAVVAALPVDSSYLVITKIVGVFVAETLNVGGTPQATSSAGATIEGASTTQLSAQYFNAAADIYRADIAAVPGSGSILGLFRVGTIKYAFRNNSGGTAAEMYKSSASGWTLVALGRELSFTSGGTIEIVEGNTITGATSAATGVVSRVVLTSGTWAGGNAAGKFILSSQTGTFVAENLNVGANPNLATIAGNSTAITLQPNGRFEVELGNFGGQLSQRRAYGCDKVNRGWEFDGTVFVPIDTGMSPDNPTHVAVHKNHLFFSFDSSVQHSSIGNPYIWSPITGASEIATQDTVTGFKPEPGVQTGASLGIYNRNSIHVLYGSSSADWNLVQYRDEIGAYPYTIQQLSSTMFLDDRGIANLATTQAFGNFQYATISNLIKQFIVQHRGQATGSCIVRDKNQYRIFFSDGYGLYITMAGNKVMGIMPVLFSNPVTCVFSLETTDGTEEIFFGSSNGFVYHLDAGTSLDGGVIEAFIYLHYYNSKSVNIRKTYKDATIESSGTGYSSFNFGFELGYSSSDIYQPPSETVDISFGSVNWDSFVWDTFVWDLQTLSPSMIDIGGTAENISFIISKSSDYMNPARHSGLLLNYVFRRQIK